MQNDESKKDLKPRTYTVDDIAQILDIGRTSAYRLVQRECFRSVKIGSAIRISRKSFDTWLDEQLDEEEFDFTTITDNE